MSVSLGLNKEVGGWRYVVSSSEDQFFLILQTHFRIDLNDIEVHMFEDHDHKLREYLKKDESYQEHAFLVEME